MSAKIPAERDGAAGSPFSECTATAAGARCLFVLGSRRNLRGSPQADEEQGRSAVSGPGYLAAGRDFLMSAVTRACAGGHDRMIRRESGSLGSHSAAM